jgi:hypothetical protein
MGIIHQKDPKLQIMLFNSHLDIQSDEFTHVSMSERVLCSENWTDFKNSLEVSHNTHLFI